MSERAGRDVVLQNRTERGDEATTQPVAGSRVGSERVARQVEVGPAGVMKLAHCTSKQPAED